uniref:Uncharacterized protein n=1 Tax=Oncorhynchus mykiss TaxID=8022 RepID=A0A8K9UCG8_ONCMY
MAVSRFDIDAPRWDQSTFIGRLKHFVNITDWRTALLPDSRLDESKALYTHTHRYLEVRVKKKKRTPIKTRCWLPHTLGAQMQKCNYQRFDSQAVFVRV